MAYYFFAGHAVHAKISYYKINAAFCNFGKTFFSICSFFDIIAFKFKIIGKTIAYVFFVIDC